jgi:hypothetical protein
VWLNVLVSPAPAYKSFFGFFFTRAKCKHYLQREEQSASTTPLCVDRISPAAQHVVEYRVVRMLSNLAGRNVLLRRSGINHAS